MTARNCALIGAAFALALPAVPVCGVGGVSPLVEALRTHQAYLHELALGKAGAPDILRVIYEPIPDEMAAKERVNVIDAVSWIGSYAWGSWAVTGFIEDERATGVLGAGLLDEDASVRERACEELARLGKDRYLVAIAAEIQQTARQLPQECGAHLLGRLNLRLDEAQDLLARPLPVEVRARLGDAGWEQKLITAFTDATDFTSKAGAAYTLGYVGTRAAGIALVHALHSPMFRGTGEGDRMSIRIAIIEALGHIHQEELLLTERILWIAARGDKVFGGSAAIAAYLDRVYAWAQATYGIEPEGPEPGPFLNDTEKSPVMH